MLYNPTHGSNGGSSRLAPVKRLPLAGASRISSVTDLRYDHLTPEAAIFTANVLNQSGQRPTEGLLRAAAYKTLREAERGGAAYSPVVKALHYMKADEVLASNLSGAGQEWVGVAYEQRLWEKARQSPIYQQMLALGMFQVEIPKGANSVFIPAEGNDPTWYSLPEQNDTDATERAPIAVKDSKVSTPRRQLTPGQLGARVMYTDVLDEDSLVPMAAILMQQMERSAQEIMEFVILNGDTATTANTNINLSDSTPSLDSKGRGPSYLAFDGILKLPLVTATALGRDAGVAFDEQDFLDTLKLLPKSERQTRERLMYILDSDALIAAMAISTFKTRDVFSPATIEEGILTRVYGIPVYESGQMGLAAATGKVSATGANNTKGRLLIVRPDQWAVGFKRQIKTEVSRDIEAQSNTIVSTMRFAITSRSAAGGAALSYNVPV